MNTSGEAADQVVRMSLEVGEAALKISGEGAKQLAVLLYAILKEQKKTKGRARLETLVRSGKPLTVFSVKESDLKKFVQEAKRYGILYCAVRDPKGSSDGMVDIMVKEEDAPRINRIVERFKFASVTEAAQIKTEIQKSREEKSQAKGEKAAPGKEKTKEPPKKKPSPEKTKAGEPQSQPEPEKDRPGKSQEDLLVDELLGSPVQKEEGQRQNPSSGRAAKSRQSEPISGKQRKIAEGTSKLYQPATPEKPSVREELKEIQAARKKEADAPSRGEPAKDTKSKNQKPLQHKQPQAKRKNKKSKER
ncbi:PcfB family protein [bacterium D16-51]|nr:PcfB family protein [bacterium D16-59]RKI57401.1 PcfB family protein [bacterium D16-51]